MRFLVRGLLALPLVVTLTACGDVHPLPDRADVVDVVRIEAFGFAASDREAIHIDVPSGDAMAYVADDLLMLRGTKGDPPSRMWYESYVVELRDGQRFELLRGTLGPGLESWLYTDATGWLRLRNGEVFMESGRFLDPATQPHTRVPIASVPLGDKAVA